MKKFAVVDYKCGNIASLLNFLNKFDFEFILTNDEVELSSATHLILPGVGNFDYAVKKLKELNLYENLKKLILEDKKMTLGICLGMQLFFEESEEGSGELGLGVIEGKVKKIPSFKDINIPNTGWWDLKGDFNNIFDNKVNSKDSFYFVHSYFCFTNVNCDKLYINHDTKILAAFSYENIVGVQFHPEKSQKSGKKVIDYFISLNG